MFYLFKHTHIFKTASHIYFACMKIFLWYGKNLLFYEKFKQQIIITITKQYKHYWYFVFYFQVSVAYIDICRYKTFIWRKMLDFINIILLSLLFLDREIWIFLHTKISLIIWVRSFCLPSSFLYIFAYFSSILLMFSLRCIMWFKMFAYVLFSFYLFILCSITFAIWFLWKESTFFHFHK